MFDMKLQDYLKKNKIKQVDFAKRLGITPIYLNFVLHGRRRFGSDVALRCVGLTGGKVTLEELLTKS